MVVFGVTSLFAFIVVVLGGLVTNFTDSYLGGFFSFAALGIATGILTLLTLPAMLAVSLIRKGAITSMIVVEIAWTWFLWILWLSVGGSTASIYLIGNCGRYSGFAGSVEAACNESTAIAAFGFLSWILLMAYNAALITLTFRQHLRGNSGVWTRDIIETDFNAPGNTTQVVYDNKVNPGFAPQYPPAQMGTPVAATQPYPQSPYAQPQATGSYPHPQSAQV